MITNLINKIFPDNNEKFINKNSHLLIKINEEESKLINLSDEELSKYSRQLLSSNNTSTNEELIVKSFSIVREASRRFLGMRHFDVQILGGLALNEGNITEMKTGEGKTLVATLPSYLNAISDNKVHVVTVNDYLAKRDAIWMGEIYSFLGLSVGYLQNNSSYKLTTDQNNNITSIASERKEIYECDIVYGTNSEFGFDYLRDNMIYEQSQKVQKTLDFAIIDEVDNILIDEARTPLIISGSSNQQSNDYLTFANLANRLILNSDFEIDEKSKSVYLTEEGISKAENALKLSNLYDTENVKSLHFLENSLKAKAIFEKNKDYVVNDNKVILVDEFTGRLMPGRRYSDGLHQAIEAKEKVTIQSESITQATITLQNYFRMYPKLSGMTGTAATEANELMEIYNLEVISIPTHEDMIRIDQNDEVYRTAEEKWEAVIENIKVANKKKQPVLVGTTSIEKSEMLSKILKKQKIIHSVLNARHHEEEANIIAQAGIPGSVTIATNMAGRGTDIQLGGNFEMLKNNNLQKEDKLLNDIVSNKNLAIKSGGLYVIGTERHESRRTDNQLRGRSGRQGDPGESKFFLSLEDDLMRIFGSEKLDNMLLKLGLKKGEAIVHTWINRALEKAQQKVEARNFEIRKNLLRFDDVMNDQRKVIYEQRKDLIQTDNISETVENMREEVIESLVENNIPPKAYPEKWNTKGLSTSLKELGLNLPVIEWSKEDGIAEEELKLRILNAAKERTAEKINLFGEDNMRLIEKQIMLQIIDQNWKELLLQLDHIRQGIGLRAYAQRDPLNEYKSEAFNLFYLMLEKVRMQTTAILLNIQITTEIPQRKQQKTNFFESQEEPKLKNKGIKSKKIGRNETCPCGSGKKYKYCHGKAA